MIGDEYDEEVIPIRSAHRVAGEEEHEEATRQGNETKDRIERPESSVFRFASRNKERNQ